MDAQTPFLLGRALKPRKDLCMNKIDSSRKRKHRVTIRLDDEEYAKLCEWSTACRMTMNDYTRMLIRGFQPVEFPPLEYREILKELRKIGVNMNQVASKAHSLGFIDAPEYEKNVKLLWKVVADFSEPLTEGGVKFGSNKNMGGQK